MGPLAMVHIVPFFLLYLRQELITWDVQVAMREMIMDCGQLHFPHTLANIEAKFANIGSLNPEKQFTALNFS